MTTNNADFEPGCETSAHNPTIICCHPSSWPMKFCRESGTSPSRARQLGIGEVEGHGLKRDSAKGIRCRAPPSPTVAMPRLRTSWKLACMGFPQAGTQAKRTLQRKQRQRRSKTQRVRKDSGLRGCGLGTSRSCHIAPTNLAPVEQTELELALS